MIIFNKKDSVYFEISGITSGSFAIYPYDYRGCLEENASVTGELIPGGGDFMYADVKFLKDGDYELQIISDEAGTQIYKFSVFYNALPEVIKSLRDIFCNKNCTDCNTEDFEKDVLKVYTKTMIFAVASGLYNSLPGIRFILTKIQKVLFAEEINKRYYGNSNFSYKEHLQVFFLYFYSELYNYQKDKIKSLNIDTLYIDKIFLKEEIEICLRSSQPSLEEVLQTLSNLNCDCDGGL